MKPTTIYLFRIHCYGLSIAALLCLMSCNAEPSEPIPFPDVWDEQLQLDLIASAPNIVTPIGLAIDRKDAIYVLESHTHVPLSEYSGPKFDRIRKGVDQNKDGIPERWITFADSLSDGMNLVCGPEDQVYLAGKDEITVFWDTDLDGWSDKREILLEMTEPEEVYDHAGILGITYSPDGWLYISRGNTGGQAWRIEGTDGRFLEGYGDGGNIMRCRPDGSNLEEVATGFWNPFDLKFTSDGRLLAADNDPDSRGPNRLLDIVPGGNYGYKSIYGGSGIHPFLAWNGELPGTLPYAAALGEAPSGLLDATHSNFPEAYRQAVLVTIWEENSIVVIPLKSRNSTVAGTAQVLVQGDENFHPVAMAANSRGEIYISDWVLRQYPNHGQGRIWRLRSGADLPLNQGAPPIEEAVFAALPGSDNRDQLLKALESEDVFAQARARYVLRDPDAAETLLGLTNSTNSVLRLQSLLTLFNHSVRPEKEDLGRLLFDEEEVIRRMTLIYIAERSRTDLLAEVEEMNARGLLTPKLFETYLATIRHLQPAFVEAIKTKTESNTKKLSRSLPPDFIWSIISDARLPDTIRAAALPYLEQAETHIEPLRSMAKTASRPLQAGLLQLFRGMNDEQVAATLVDMALNTELETATRAEAVLALNYQSGMYCGELRALLEENSELLVGTVLHYLCRCTGVESIKTAVEGQFAKKGGVKGDAMRAVWELCNGTQDNDNRPQTAEAWKVLAAKGGNAERGRLVFQSPYAQCQNCHQVDNWGGNFGPDLSNVGSSKTQEQLITAILEPSLEISPEWQGWFVKTSDGTTHYGRQIDVGFKNIELMTQAGEFVTFPKPATFGLTPASLMPEGLEMGMTTREFADLMAYLGALQ